MPGRKVVLHSLGVGTTLSREVGPIAKAVTFARRCTMDSKQRFTRNEVMAIPAPAYTKTWHPVPHKDVIESLDLVTRKAGVGVMQETYSVTNKGANMFGAWTLDIGMDGKQVQMGFRNSISKQFAVGICAGTWVMVCSNMAFRGDFIEFRKHTSGLDMEELLSIGLRAFDRVVVDGNA